MEAIAIRNAAPQAATIGAPLFGLFVQYLDRSTKTTRTYLTNLKQFMAWMKYTDTPQPIRQDVINYREWLRADHPAIILDTAAPQGWRYRTDRKGHPQRLTCKETTVKQYLQSVRQFFTWTESERLYPNIAKNIHAPKLTDHHKKDSLTPGEVMAIEASITKTAEIRKEAAAAADKDRAGRIQRSSEQGKRLYAIYLLAVNAGLRTVEISRANVKDLETKNGAACLYVWGKGHHEPDAKKPLAPEVYAAILDYLRSRTDHPTGAAPLFVSTGNRSGGKRIAPTTISRWIKAAMVEAGYKSERLTAHSLRHTAGQAVMEITGNNLYRTQLYMRHDNPRTTEIYLDNERAAQDADLARQVYQHYHGSHKAQPQAQAPADQIRAAMDTMNPAQLEKLAALAAAITA